MAADTRVVLLLGVLAFACACSEGTPPAAPPSTSPVRTFADTSVQELRQNPDAHVGEVFAETFTFSKVWWSQDRARPNQPSLDLPTHFTARIVAAPVYIARIEFPPEADTLFENMREGTDVRLRVRFLHLHPASMSPVFAFEKLLPPNPPGSDLEHLRR